MADAPAPDDDLDAVDAADTDPRADPRADAPRADAESEPEVALGDTEDDRDAARVVEHLLRHPGDLGSYIRAQREEARLSLRKLATLAGVSNPYLSQIERGLRNPSAEILQGIARALEISSETLYVRAGLLEDVEPEVGVEEAIEHALELTDAQKATLLEMYRSFVRLAALEE